MKMKSDKERKESKIPRSIVISLLRAHPSPNDMLIHNFAIQHGYEIDDLEEEIYKIAGESVKKK